MTKEDISIGDCVVYSEEWLKTNNGWPKTFTEPRLTGDIFILPNCIPRQVLGFSKNKKFVQIQYRTRTLWMPVDQVKVMVKNHG